MASFHAIQFVERSFVAEITSAVSSAIQGHVGTVLCCLARSRHAVAVKPAWKKKGTVVWIQFQPVPRSAESVSVVGYIAVKLCAILVTVHHVLFL